jgi:hypothetical protein
MTLTLPVLIFAGQNPVPFSSYYYHPPGQPSMASTILREVLKAFFLKQF